MIGLRDIFKKYTGFLRSLKVVYILNNFLNRNKLRHNKELYKKFNIQKSIYSSIGSHHFKNDKQALPWLDQKNALENLKSHPDFQQFSKAEQTEIKRFIEEGYMILKGFYSKEATNILKQEVEKLLEKGKTDFNYTGKKLMDAHRFSNVIDQDYFKNERLLKLLSFVMGKKVVPFQTINFIEGSEQRAHSDSIHMTTEPQGYLIATWTALENCDERNGPLFYYPGSHRLPFVSCQDYASGNTLWQLGKFTYQNYEDKIAAVIEENNFEKKQFHAEEGDMLIWHANLLHGGSPITEEGRTRKSMVAHYFCEEVICYHEISQRPALIDK